MQLKTKAIVLSSKKYGDTSLIARCFTESSGLVTYFIRGAFSSKRKGRTSAYFQPLTQLELVANHKGKGTMESIKEFKVAYPYMSLHTEITKSSIALFLSEVLTNCITEEEQDNALFTFLESSFQWLDTHEGTSNFHIYFLLELTKYLGFYPDLQKKTDALF